jgi:two-component system, cell cycle sensor histidine kinase and response regulator CckA
MPMMDGMTTFQELRRIKPDVKVILCSGYSEEETCGNHEKVGLAGFLDKPYSLDQLRETLKKTFFQGGS